MRRVMIISLAAVIMAACGQDNTGPCPSGRKLEVENNGWFCYYLKDGEIIKDGPWSTNDNHGLIIGTGHYCDGKLCGCIENLEVKCQRYNDDDPCNYVNWLRSQGCASSDGEGCYSIRYDEGGNIVSEIGNLGDCDMECDCQWIPGTMPAERR